MCHKNYKQIFVSTLVMLIGFLFLLSGCAGKTGAPLKVGRVTAQAAETGADNNGSAGKNVSDQTSPEQGLSGVGAGELSVNKPAEIDVAAEVTVPATAGRPPDEADSDNPYPVPPPDPPGTAIRTFYQTNGEPPSAPGLAMRKRIFYPEPAQIAYLTIDDGPYPETTPRILKILKDEGVHATFFVIGTQVKAHPDLLKAEYEQGNAIGNHTYSHNYKVIYPSPAAFLADVRKNGDLIYSIIGFRPHIVRAPGGTQGHFSVSYFNALDAADYLVYDWNVSTADSAASAVPADTIVQNVKSQVAGKDRVIILMHDAAAKTTTVEALPRIIHFLKDKGYSFGVLTPHVAPIVFPGGFKN